MRFSLYNAAGNRILWLRHDSLSHSADFAAMRNLGLDAVKGHQFGQDLTGVLFASHRSFKALFWNQDGSAEDICGNALRCLADFMVDDSISTGRGRRTVHVQTPWSKYQCHRIGANRGSVIMPARSVRAALTLPNGDLWVDVGTPHQIRVVDRSSHDGWPVRDVAEARMRCTGPAPANFSLVRREAGRHYRIRTFERGAGETGSCGTAAVATVAALGRVCTPNLPVFAQWPRQQAVDSRQTSTLEFASGQVLRVIDDRRGQTFEVDGPIERLMAFPALVSELKECVHV